MKPQRVNETQHTATEWCSTTNGAATPVFDRVVDILDAHTDIGVLDCPDGRTILTWKTTCDLATAIATDKALAALISDPATTRAVSMHPTPPPPDMSNRTHPLRSDTSTPASTHV